MYAKFELDQSMLQSDQMNDCTQKWLENIAGATSSFRPRGFNIEGATPINVRHIRRGGREVHGREAAERAVELMDV